MAQVPQHHTTRHRHIIADKIATRLISVIGLSVIVAVVGMMVFLVNIVLPLGRSEKLEHGFIAGDAGGAFALMADDLAPIVMRTRMGSDDACAFGIYDARAEMKETDALFLARPGGPGSAFALTREPGQSQGFSCLGLSNSTFLVIENTPEGPARVTRLALDLGREFLSDDDIQTMEAADLRALETEKFRFLASGQVLARNSRSAPIARIVPQVATLETFEFPRLPTYFMPERVQDMDFEVRTFDGGSGLFLVKTSEGTFEDALLFSRSENAITGAVSFNVKRFDVSDLGTGAAAPTGKASETLVGTSLVEGKEIWRFLSDGRILRAPTPSGDDPLAVLPTLNGHARIAGVDALQRVVKVFGGSSFFFDDGQGTCGVVDAGRHARVARLDDTAPASASSPQIAPLWTAECAPSSLVRLIPHPHARLLLRQTDTALEAFELTSGRTAFEYDLHGISELLDGRVKASEISARDLKLAFSRNGHSVIARYGDSAFVMHLDAPHLDASKEAFFSAIHYEGYDAPSYSWQSTSGTDDFQAKYSLIPLIWGTFKATFYALIFAVPLGIFAAIYSSEILDRATRNVVKPSIEMMASLPSVVLGFLAAIIIAPWVENHVVSVLLIGVATPFMLYMAGNLFSRLSAKQVSARGLYASRQLLAWMLLGFLASIYLLVIAGEQLELTAFGGDLKAFLAGGPGTEGVLWGILLLPVVTVAFWSLPHQRFPRIYRTISFFLAPWAAVLIGYFIASQSDLKEEVFGTYSQRNTLVISIAMGFAIIPIIYSLAEDALTAVPSSLRAASLACGASVWQTTARVVLPTAASGIFSALMVGFGRGIGETMIAVMATGNSAVMTVNPFDGLRSLSANIAVELPEAAQGSTHYRILFLSGLILFAFTFTLNSFAEFLRAKYRERNKAL